MEMVTCSCLGYYENVKVDRYEKYYKSDKK